MNRVFLCLVTLSVCSFLAMPTDARTIAAKTVTKTDTPVTVIITHVIYQDNAVLTGNDYTLSADRFDVEYKNKVMTGLTASGKIKLVINKTDATYILTSRHATYDPSASKVTLSDHVQSPLGSMLLNVNPKAKAQIATSFTFRSSDPTTYSPVNWPVLSVSGGVCYTRIGPEPQYLLDEFQAADKETHPRRTRKTSRR